MEEFLIEKRWIDLISDRERYPDISKWTERNRFRQEISWHVPTRSLVDLLVKVSPVISVGSGFAYTESLVEKNGGDIIATDIQPDLSNHWCQNGQFRMVVEKLEASQAVSKYPDRNVFMAWPPYDNPMAHSVVHTMVRGRILVFVGEIEGCTGDNNFFKYLEKHFEEMECDAIIPSWPGIYDSVHVYMKK